MLFRYLLVLALAMAAGAAHAGDWKDASIGWQYYAYGLPYDGGGSPGQCTVGAEKTVCGTFFDYFTLETQPNAIVFDYSRAGKWAKSHISLRPTIHSGVAINLASAGTITAVTIDPATNMVGFDASHISFTPKQIQVDWARLPFNRRTKVKLHVEVSQEPAAPRGAMLTSNPPRL